MLSEKNLEDITLSEIGKTLNKELVSAIVKHLFPTCSSLHVGQDYFRFFLDRKYIEVNLRSFPSGFQLSLSIMTEDETIQHEMNRYATFLYARPKTSFLHALATSVSAKLTATKCHRYSFIERGIIQHEDNSYRIYLNGSRLLLRMTDKTALLSDSDKAHFETASPEVSERINVLSDIQTENGDSDTPNLFEESSIFNNPNAIEW